MHWISPASLWNSITVFTLLYKLPSGSSKKSACKSPHPLVQQSLLPELMSIKSELDGKQAGKRVSSSKTKGLSNFKMTKSFSDVASIYSNPGLLFQINPVMFLVYYQKIYFKQESMRIDSKIASRLHKRNKELVYCRRTEMWIRFGQNWFIRRIGRKLGTYLGSEKCNVFCIGGIEWRFWKCIVWTKI